MVNVYSSGDALLRDYEKLSPEYKNKAGKYIKNLLKIQRAENGVRAEIFKLERSAELQSTGKYRCNFCGKSENDAFRLFMGPNVSICDECARLCCEILDDEESKDDKN